MSRFVSLCVFAAVTACATAHAGWYSEMASAMALKNIGGADKISCGECSLVVGIAEELATNKTKADGAAAAAEALCASKLNGTAASVCKEVAKLVIEDALPFIFKETSTLAWPEPAALCSVILEVCPQPVADGVSQVRLSSTGNATETMVTWVTGSNFTGSPAVQYGLSASALTRTVASAAHTYTVGAWVGSIHTAVMTHLAANTTYFYRASDGAAWSDVFSFRTMPADVGSASRPLRIVHLGDTGYSNVSDDTIAAITKAVQAGHVDMVLMNGDGGYADGFAPHDDAWGNKIEPISSRVWFETAAGNHELWFNFTAYKARYARSTPAAAPDGMYYSLQIGNVLHLSVMNTESPIDTPNVDSMQQAWLRKDLSSAEAQASAWRVAAGHRPLYCSDGGTQCNLFASILMSQVEDILHDGHADMVLQSHEHNGESSYPLYRGQPAADGPTYIVNGAGGNREGNPHIGKPQPWSTWQSADRMYGLMEVTTSTLTYSFVSSATGDVLHKVSLTK